MLIVKCSRVVDNLCFSRFYFVGDEDLLEIIGNSKNVSRLQKHFKKMFAGVTSIIIDEEKALITGICSKEGEEVSFLLLIQMIHWVNRKKVHALVGCQKDNNGFGFWHSEGL